MTLLRDQRREQTRRRLYEAALEVFRRDEVASCRIDDIAIVRMEQLYPFPAEAFAAYLARTATTTGGAREPERSVPA